MMIHLLLGSFVWSAIGELSYYWLFDLFICLSIAWIVWLMWFHSLEISVDVSGVKVQEVGSEAAADGAVQTK